MVLPRKPSGSARPRADVLHRRITLLHRWNANDWGEGLETLKVSGKSRPNAVAGAIAALLRSQGEVEVQAIGPAAVNQAVKAIAIARGYIIPENLDLHTQPAFVKLDIDDEERTAVRFAVRGFKLS